MMVTSTVTINYFNPHKTTVLKIKKRIEIIFFKKVFYISRERERVSLEKLEST
jgi:hypothetical protein